MFRKAERKKAKLRLALDGPAGSGKTLGALYVATGLGGKIAMIDTERGSGELYSDKADYDVAQICPPFSPDKYITAIKEAEKAGYSVLIIDSLSHAWEGEGGLLDMHDRATKAQRQQNSFTAWKEITPLHNELVNTILQSNLHVIVTLRTKTAYEITKDESGKTKPIKIGTKPIFREGVEYEFTSVLDLSVEGHIATSSKDRTGLFDGKHIVLSKETGAQLREWLESGVDAEAVARETVNAIIERVHKIENMFELRNWYKKHEHEIDELPPKHKSEVMNTLSNLKKQFQFNEAKEVNRVNQSGG